MTIYQFNGDPNGVLTGSTGDYGFDISTGNPGGGIPSNFFVCNGGTLWSAFNESGAPSGSWVGLVSAQVVGGTNPPPVQPSIPLPPNQVTPSSRTAKPSTTGGSGTVSLPRVDERKRGDAAPYRRHFPYPRLVLKPDVVVNTAGSVQFQAFLQSGVGELLLGADLLFQSDNTGVLTINPATGLASLLVNGSAQVSVQWQNLKAYAQVTVVVDCPSNCIEIVVDRSRSMADPFNQVFPTKLSVAKLLAWQLALAFNTAKDTAGLIEFDTYAREVVPVGSSAFTVANFAAIQQSDGATILKTGLDLALANIYSQSNTGLIALFTDGRSYPEMDELDRLRLMDAAATFKQAGNILMIVGIRAEGEAYEMLQKLASSGWFLNVLADQGETHVDRVAGLITGLLQFACSAVPTMNLAYLYELPATNFPVPPQTADPSPLREDGEQPGVRPHYRGTMSFNNNTAPVSATANSDVSQEDADARALELAMLRWTMLQFASAYE